IDGKGGTSKSHLIRLLFYKLINIVSNLPKPIIITAPISIATNNINGYTIHSLFKLPFSIGTLNSLNSIKLSKFRKYKYFIINKKSILNIKNIYFINKKLQQMFLEN
ncbi:hypothetical protein GE21DRAFT_1206942, partial [Neurospora crassa]